ncbi:DUF7657 domain-containing protein [Paenibacillus aceti]|uniref:DUF7657 domain-containing protein n=1 Tax=Paenibacillus aceti TaxID=1820010 RepID=UPI003F6A6A7A
MKSLFYVRKSLRLKASDYCKTLILDNRSLFKINRKEIITLFFSVLFALGSVLFYLYYALDDLKLMLGTDYPGNRFVQGGGFSLLELQNYLVNWLLPFKDVNFSNNSEVSSYYNFIPLLLLTFVALIRYEKRKYTFYSLYLFMLFQLSWLFVKYPSFIAKISLFSYVQEGRLAHIALGFLSVLLSIWMIGIIIEHKPFSKFEKVCSCIVVAIIYASSLINTPMMSYLGIVLTIVTLIWFLTINYFICNGKFKLFAVVMLPIVITGMLINPISRGTGAIKNLEISKEIINIESRSPGQTWMANNSIYNGQLLVSLGMKVLNGVHFTPDISLWEKVDTQGKYRDIYNRYAHVMVNIVNEETNFVLDNPDVFTLNIHYRDVSKLNVKYLLSNVEIPIEMNIEPIYKDLNSGLLIYQLY